MSSSIEDDLMARDEEMALAIYERSIRQVVGPEDANKFVAVAVESGDFEIDPDELPAVDRLRARHDSNARVWLMRVGPEPAHRIGWFGRSAGA